MTAKHEITRKFALAYAGATKRDKGRLLDEVCAITGWSRANFRRKHMLIGSLADMPITHITIARQAALLERTERQRRKALALAL